MGKHDRRKSLKMRRRQGQAKKKARALRRVALRKAQTTTAKKATKKVPAAPAVPA